MLEYPSSGDTDRGFAAANTGKGDSQHSPAACESARSRRASCEVDGAVTIFVPGFFCPEVGNRGVVVDAGDLEHLRVKRDDSCESVDGRRGFYFDTRRKGIAKCHDGGGGAEVHAGGWRIGREGHQEETHCSEESHDGAGCQGGWQDIACLMVSSHSTIMT